MMSMGNFWLQMLLAGVVLLLALYVPGRLFYRCLRLNLQPLEASVLAWVAGTALLVLAYWGLTQMGVPYLLWAYVALALGVEMYFSIRDWLRQQKGYTDPDAETLEPLWNFWPLGLFLLAGILMQTYFTAWTGWISPTGLKILAWHGHDAPWHIYNLSQLAHRFPPEMPGFAGFPLQNYHFFSDLLWGALLRLVPLDPWHIYFRVAPPFYSALLTLTMFIAAREWAGNLRSAYLAVGITLCASTLGYAMPLFFGSQSYFYWESIFWIQSPVTLIFNPGVSSSLGFVMLGVWALTKWVRRQNWLYLVILALCWGVLPGFKVYPGLLVLFGLLVTGAIWMILYRGGRLITPFIFVLPFFLLVYLPFNWQAPSLVRFLPGYNLGAMLVAPDRMALLKAAELKALFVHHPFGVAGIMAGLALVFLVGNLGIRVIGLIPMLRSLRQLREADPILVWMTVVVAAAWVIPVFFVQTGIQWNTIQFFYYAMLLTALPAAKQFWDWADAWKPWVRYAALALLLLAGAPCMLQAFWRINFYAQMNPNYLDGMLWLQQNAKPGSVIVRPLPLTLRSEEGYQAWQRSQERGQMTTLQKWNAEAQALANSTNAQAGPVLPQGNSISALATGAVPVSLTPTAASLLPAPPAKVDSNAWPAWEEDDTAIVASLTRCNTYLEDTVSSQIMGLPVKSRVEEVRKFYQTANIIEAREFLEKNAITYVILLPDMTLPFDPAGVYLKTVFSNPAIRILKRLSLRVGE